MGVFQKLHASTSRKSEVGGIVEPASLLVWDFPGASADRPFDPGIFTAEAVKVSRVTRRLFRKGELSTRVTVVIAASGGLEHFIHSEMVKVGWAAQREVIWNRDNFPDGVQKSGSWWERRSKTALVYSVDGTGKFNYEALPTVALLGPRRKVNSVWYESGPDRELPVGLTKTIVRVHTDLGDTVLNVCARDRGQRIRDTVLGEGRLYREAHYE